MDNVKIGNNGIVEIWSPPFAPHVKGGWTVRETNDNGLPGPMKIYCYCSKCDTSWQQTCSTGTVKSWINRFAITHLHSDPFDKPVHNPISNSAKLDSIYSW